MGAFTASLANFEQTALSKVDKVTRVIALEVFRRIIMRTPVDTGRARGNWVCSIGVPAAAMAQGEDWFKGQLSGDTDPSGGSTVQSAADEVMTWNPRDVAIYLTNNLPYIKRLEDGYSQQAPAGMVAITIAEFDGIATAVMR